MNHEIFKKYVRTDITKLMVEAMASQELGENTNFGPQIEEVLDHIYFMATRLEKQNEDN